MYLNGTSEIMNANSDTLAPIISFRITECSSDFMPYMKKNLPLSITLFLTSLFLSLRGSDCESGHHGMG